MASATFPARVTAESPPRFAKTRASLGAVGRRAMTVASAAKSRYRRPALVIGSFASIDLATWHTLGMGAGLLVLGALGLCLELLCADE